MAKEFILVNCDFCNHFHPLNFDGDCRDGSNRYTQEQADEIELRQENERNWNPSGKVSRNKADH